MKKYGALNSLISFFLLIAITAVSMPFKPLAGTTVSIYVKDDGSDTLGNGTFEKPYATISAAYGGIPENSAVACEIRMLSDLTVTGQLVFDMSKNIKIISYNPQTDMPSDAPNAIKAAAGGRWGSIASTTGMIYISAGSVTLDNVTIDANRQTRVICVNYAGTLLTVNDGALITGGVYTGTGAGVYLSGGTFTMNGGGIVGNTASSTTGGGVYLSGGAFTMLGGTIANNTAFSHGAGVYINSGAFAMYGGTVTGNTASNSTGATNGGGVYITGANSEFIMHGGEITYNTAANSTVNSSGGGGVYVTSSGRFTMNGGEVKLNHAGGSGGGLYMNGGAFTVSGGEITGNTANKNGGGVYIGSNIAAFNIGSGSVPINITGNSVGGGQNNVLLAAADKSITILGSPAAGSQIGLSMAVVIDSPVIVATGAGGNGGEAFWRGVFRPDGSLGGIGLSGDNVMLDPTLESSSLNIADAAGYTVINGTQSGISGAIEPVTVIPRPGYVLPSTADGLNGLDYALNADGTATITGTPLGGISALTITATQPNLSLTAVAGGVAVAAPSSEYKYALIGPSPSLGVAQVIQGNSDSVKFADLIPQSAYSVSAVNASAPGPHIGDAKPYGAESGLVTIPGEIYVHPSRAAEPPDGTLERPYKAIRDAYEAAGYNGSYEILVMADLTVDAEIKADMSKTVTLQSYGAGAPWKITRGGSFTGTILNVEAGSVSLKNIVLDGQGGLGGFGGNTEASAALVRAGAISASPSLTLGDGAVLRNNKLAAYGSPDINASGAVAGIIGNKAANGTLIIQDGAKIQYNQASDIGSAGGVLVFGSGAGLIMTGGAIEYNTALGGDGAGGIFIASSASARLNGGTISGNNGSGVTGAFEIGTGEKPVIIQNNTDGNVCLPDGAYIALAGRPADGSKIGVSAKPMPNAAGQAFTAATGASGEEDFWRNVFFSDNPAQAGIKVENGTVKLSYDARSALGTYGVDRNGNGYAEVFADPSFRYALLSDDGTAVSNLKLYSKNGEEISIEYSNGWYGAPSGNIYFKNLEASKEYMLVRVNKSDINTVPKDLINEGQAFAVPSVGDNVSAAVDSNNSGKTAITVAPSSDKLKYAVADPETGNVRGGTGGWMAGGGIVMFDGLEANKTYEVVAVQIGEITPPSAYEKKKGNGASVVTPDAGIKQVGVGEILRETQGTDKILLHPSQYEQDYNLRDPQTGQWAGDWRRGAEIEFNSLKSGTVYEVLTRTPAKPGLDASVPMKPVYVSLCIPAASVSGFFDAPREDAHILISPADAGLEYGLAYSRGGTAREWQHVSGSPTPIKFEGLSPETEYRLSARPRNVANPPNPAEAGGGLLVITPPAAVTGIKRNTDAGGDRITFTTATGYEYALTDGSGVIVIGGQWLEGTGGERSVGGLVSGMAYKALVRVKETGSRLSLANATEVPPVMSVTGKYMPDGSAQIVFSPAAADSKYAVVDEYGMVQGAPDGWHTSTDNGGSICVNGLALGQKYKIIEADKNADTSALSATDLMAMAGKIIVTPVKPVDTKHIKTSCASVTVKQSAIGRSYAAVDPDTGAASGGWKDGDGTELEFTGLISGKAYEIVTVPNPMPGGLENSSALYRPGTTAVTGFSEVYGDYGAAVTVSPANTGYKYAAADGSGIVVGGVSGWKDGSDGALTFVGLASGAEYKIICLPDSAGVFPATGWQGAPGVTVITPPAPVLDANVYTSYDSLTIRASGSNYEYALTGPDGGIVNGEWKSNGAANGAVTFRNLFSGAAYRILTRIKADSAKPDAVRTYSIPGIVAVTGFKTFTGEAGGGTASVAVSPASSGLMYAAVDDNGEAIGGWKAGNGGEIVFSGLRAGGAYRIAVADAIEPLVHAYGVSFVAPPSSTGIGVEATGNSVTLTNTSLSCEYAVIEPLTGRQTTGWKTGSGGSLIFEGLIYGTAYDLAARVRGDGSGKIYVPAVIKQFTAGSPAITYTVSMGTVCLTAGEGAAFILPGMDAAALPPPEMSRPVFAGWSDGMGIYKAGGVYKMPAKNVTFIPIWQDTYSVGGTVMEHTGNGFGGAAVTLSNGSRSIGTAITDANGNYSFLETVPNGIYNISATDGSRTVTQTVAVSGENAGGTLISLPQGNRNSVVEIRGADMPHIAVGNVDKQLDGLLTQEYSGVLEDGGMVELRFIAAGKAEEAVSDLEITAFASENAGMEVALYLNFSVERTVKEFNATGATVTHVDELPQLLEISVMLPPELQGRFDYSISYAHNGTVSRMNLSDGGAEGFRINKENGAAMSVTIFARRFSTYAIAFADNKPQPNKPYGGGGGGSSGSLVNAAAAENGSVVIVPGNPVSGQKVTVYAKPDEGYVLDKLTVTDAGGNAIPYVDNGGSAYTYTQPSSHVTVTAAFEPAPLPSKSDAGAPAGISVLAAGKSYTAETDAEGWITLMFDVPPAWIYEECIVAVEKPSNRIITRGVFSGGAIRFPASPDAEGYEIVSIYREFNDVPISHGYHRAISFAAARGIASGMGNGLFSPEADITRGQFIVMLMNAYGISPDSGSKDNFADAGDTYYTGYLASAKRLGIASGVGGNRYAPEQALTRQEMFLLVYNALKAIGELPEKNPAAKKTDKYSDWSTIAPWARVAITAMVESGTIVGDGVSLMPLNRATRSQMAQVIRNLMVR